jgi:hypothetical protein
VAVQGDARQEIGTEVQSGAAASDQSLHEVVVAVAGSGQLGETAPVVDSGLVEEGGLERWPLRMILAFLNIMWRMESDLVDRRRSLTKWRKVYWQIFEVVALVFSLASYAYL